MVLSLLKAALGISSAVRDEYLQAIIDSVLTELRDVNGMVFDLTRPDHLLFVVDLAEWRYRGRGTTQPMPPHLRTRYLDFWVSLGGQPDG